MANELSHELLGGLNAVNQQEPAQQPQQQPQGGLSPALAAQTSSVAQAADIKNTELASVNEQMRAAQSMIMPMLRRSIADQAGYEQSAKDMWARLEQTLAPRQYDTGQFLSDIARGAKGSSLVDVLSNMSSAASTGRQAFDENELKKAEYMQKMGQARADTNEKRIFDLWGKMQGKGSMATKVAGTIVDKAKQAANEKTKEFVGDKTSSAFSDLWNAAYRNSVQTMLPTYLMGVDRETADEILSNLAGLESRLGSPAAAAAQAVPQPQPAAASPQQRINLPAIEDKGAGFDFDTSKWRPEDAETVRRTAVLYQANPSYGTQEALNAALSAAMKNSGGQPAPVIGQPAPARGMTANEIKAQEKGVAATAEVNAKKFAEDYQAARTDLEKLGNLKQSASRMQDLTSNSEVFNGPLADTLTSLGGMVSYFDPKDSLAQKASNSQQYFASLQDLVRDKLRAYGSGTAVSNLDLLTAEKSQAALSTTAEGKKRILEAIVDDMTRTESILQSKKDYYEKHSTLSGWSPPPEPNKAEVNGKTVTIQDYYKAYRKRNPDASFGEIRDAWQRAISAQQK